MNAERSRKQLWRLYDRSLGSCAICGQKTKLTDDERDPYKAVRFRTGSSYGKPGRVRRRVLACRQCAQKRSDEITASQPLDELRHRARRWGDVFYVPSPQETEQQ